MTEEKKEYEYIDKVEGDEKVRDDPNLLSEEKETFIHISENSSGRKCKVYSDKRAVISGLLRHEHAKILSLRKYNGEIVGGTFEIPVGCVKIQKNKRKNDNLSSMVSS